MLDAPAAVAQVHVEPAHVGPGQRSVDAVGDQSLGALAPSASAERHHRLAQLLAGGREQPAHLFRRRSQLHGHLGARPLRQHHQGERLGCHGVERGEPRAHLATAVAGSTGPGGRDGTGRSGACSMSAREDTPAGGPRLATLGAMADYAKDVLVDTQWVENHLGRRQRSGSSRSTRTPPSTRRRTSRARSASTGRRTCRTRSSATSSGPPSSASCSAAAASRTSTRSSCTATATTGSPPTPTGTSSTTATTTSG